MKKLISLLLVLVMMLGLAACGECDHDWERATCEDPKTCSKCGETKGEPEDHEWEEEDGKTVCAECGKEKEDAEDSDASPDTEEGTFTLYAYVPESWGNPGCWAWSSTSGENVFDAWPGESMRWNGDHYTIDIPGWADYIIGNGNGGSVQTADEAVESGSDIWVVIATEGEYYKVFFSQPSDADLSELGY